MDDIDLARKVFGTFQQRYSEYLGRSGPWAIQVIDSSHESLAALTKEERRRGLAVLMQKGLLKQKGTASHMLTPKGSDACLHPDALDRYLGPSPHNAPVQTFNTLNAATVQNAQLGHGNVMNVTYSQVLTDLANKIEADPAVPAEQKSRWAGALREISTHPVSVAVVTAIVTKLAGG